MKKISLFLMLSACLLPAVSSPLRDSYAAKQLPFIEDSTPYNYWVWPTDEIPYGQEPRVNPNTIWVPRIGVWYCCIAANGYTMPNVTSKLVDWSETGVTCTYSSGYSAGTFLPISSGHYVIGAKVDGPAQFRLGFYNEVDGGFQWNSWMIMSYQSTAGVYERVFTVPEGCSLMLLLPTSSDASANPLTVTDIEIYRID